MRVQDWYIQTLEKRAAEEGVMLDYSINNEDVANAEVESNQKDQRSELNPLFANAAQVGKTESSLLRKNFPEAKKADDTMTGNPLVKVALQATFFDGLRRTDLLKMASLDYIKVAFESFHDELEKIALRIPFARTSRAGTHFARGTLDKAQKFGTRATSGKGTLVRPKGTPPPIPPGSRGRKPIFAPSTANFAGLG